MKNALTRRSFLALAPKIPAAVALTAALASAPPVAAAAVVHVPVPGGSLAVAAEPKATLASRVNVAVLNHASKLSGSPAPMSMNAANGNIMDIAQANRHNYYATAQAKQMADAGMATFEDVTAARGNRGGGLRSVPRGQRIDSVEIHRLIGSAYDQGCVDGYNEGCEATESLAYRRGLADAKDAQGLLHPDEVNRIMERISAQAKADGYNEGYTQGVLVTENKSSALRFDAKRIADISGCADIGCNVRYLGEMETRSAHLFRHEMLTDTGIEGGDMQIDAFLTSHLPPQAIEERVADEFRQRHRDIALLNSPQNYLLVKSGNSEPRRIYWFPV